VRRHRLAGKRVVMVKSGKDKRFDDVEACTHDMSKMKALSALNITEVLDSLFNYEVIGIDEGQFFPDIVPMARKLADHGKTVIIAALNGDYRQKPFESVVELFSLAEKIEKLSAVCHNCGHSASFTSRLLHDTNLELIGGKEAYRALCRLCLVARNGESENDVHNDTISMGHLKKVPFTVSEPLVQNGVNQSPIKCRGNECNA